MNAVVFWSIDPSSCTLGYGCSVVVEEGLCVSNRKVFLASSSPRRRELLASVNVPFAWASPGIDDAKLNPGKVSPAQWVMSLAFLKAASGLAHLPVEQRTQGRFTHWIVLGSDTLVVKDEQLIGQPRDAADARRILQWLSDEPHEVLTGVALIDPLAGTRDIFVDRAISSLGRLTNAQLDDYIATNSWQGKAGAYNYDEREAAGWPVSHIGDRTTIVGLPMKTLLPKLHTLGIESDTNYSGRAAHASCNPSAASCCTSSSEGVSS